LRGGRYGVDGDIDMKEKEQRCKVEGEQIGRMIKETEENEGI